ncbi:MAG TPA: D-glucuronyl C5-epimerase family protein [Thermoleophilaceae bacterium]
MSPRARSTCLALLAALWLGAPATARAAPVLVYGGDGGAQVRDDPALPPVRETDPQLPAGLGPCRAPAPPALRAAASDVKAAVERARKGGGIESQEATSYKQAYSDARAARARLDGTRRAELSSVIERLELFASRDQLTASRMPALFLQLRRNTEFWGGDPRFPPRTDVPPEPCQSASGGGNAGARIQFAGSELIFQYYPGNGLQVQPLANFGKANGIYTACRRKQARCDPEALRRLLDELVAIRSKRAGFTAWEYWFPFGGGSPPWVSGMEAGTAIQALARGSQLLGESSYLRVARAAVPIFAKSAPAGVRARGEGGGSHYALYSFAPGLRVLNGFLQAITGIYDYARVAHDDRAMALFRAGDRSARREVPRYDTGAWSLYSQGGAESTLNYHNVVTDFLTNLCSRTRAAVYCSTRQRFSAYKRRPPALRYAGPSKAVEGRRTLLAFKLDKVSCVTAVIRDAAGAEVYRSRIKVARGRHAFTWRPRRAGELTLELEALDLRKNRSVVTRQMRVTGD